jgi:cell division septal protein FtsQ
MKSNVRPLRRRSKRSLAARLRSFWVVALVVFPIAVFAILEGVRWPGFHPGFIQVNGLKATDRNDVLDRAKIDPGRNVWFMDRGAAERRIAALPYVAHAQIDILPPAHVTVAVVERVPYGCVLSNTGARGLIDETGRVLEQDCGAKQQPMFHLPAAAGIPAPGSVVAGKALAEMLRADRELQVAGSRYTLYDEDEFGGLVGIRSDGILVKFGDPTNLAAKQRLVEPILATVRGRLGTVKALDVRMPATPVVEYR